MSQSKSRGSFESMARRRQRHQRDLRRSRQITALSENYDSHDELMLDEYGDVMPPVTIIRSARGSGLTVARGRNENCR